MNTKSIKPFARQGNFVAVDNAIFDEIMPSLTGSEWQVLCLIIRKTVGWNKEHDGIAYSQFIQGTSINSNTTIKKSLDSLVKQGLIQLGKTESKTDPYHYRLNRDYELRSTESVEQPITFSVEQPITESVDTKESIKQRLNTTTDSDFRAAVIAYENEIHPSLTPSIADNIGTAVDEWGGDTVVEAIGIAAASGVRNWRYIEGVLNNWRVNGRNQKVKKGIDKKPAIVPERKIVKDEHGRELVYINGKYDVAATKEYNNGHNKQPTN